VGDIRKPLKLRFPYAAVKRIAMHEEQRETLPGIRISHRKATKLDEHFYLL
jgi:hypothetical protein